MEIVIITALGVGGATVFGGFIGLFFKKISERLSVAILAFAAGVMLAAAMVGLILPSLDMGGKYAVLVTTVGIFCGGACIDLIERMMPGLCKWQGADCGKRQSVYLFVLAIAIHNLPEGIAAGVGFGTGDLTAGLLIAAGIALQNIPEGMVVILSMICAGIPRGKSFLTAALTGVVEIIGTLLGYFVVNLSPILLHFSLAFAGGTMLWVVNCQMIPETHTPENRSLAAYSTLVGFCLMLVIDRLL